MLDSQHGLDKIAGARERRQVSSHHPSIEPTQVSIKADKENVVCVHSGTVPAMKNKVILFVEWMQLEIVIGNKFSQAGADSHGYSPMWFLDLTWLPKSHICQYDAKVEAKLTGETRG